MHRPWRVLLVDDDGDAREMYGELFTGAGYEVLQAENGAEAVEMASRRRPDVVVMDLDMPVMGGVEAIERLRCEARTRSLPIVVLSASSEIDHARAARAGCDRCLGKPCELDVLEGAVRSLIESHHLDRAVRDSFHG
jgi:CheY-like chemotaxis protein